MLSRPWVYYRQSLKDGDEDILVILSLLTKKNENLLQTRHWDTLDTHVYCTTINKILDFDPRNRAGVCFYFSIHKLLFLNINGIYF